nr:MAG TPA: hypothetical protein [Caudoviricetes sp.]
MRPPNFPRFFGGGLRAKIAIFRPIFLQYQCKFLQSLKVFTQFFTKFQPENHRNIPI